MAALLSAGERWLVWAGRGRRRRGCGRKGVGGAGRMMNSAIEFFAACKVFLCASSLFLGR